eukprot:1191038-Prorocentrum_minimum.AAC.1
MSYGCQRLWRRTPDLSYRNRGSASAHPTRGLGFPRQAPRDWITRSGCYLVIRKFTSGCYRVGHRRRYHLSGPSFGPLREYTSSPPATGARPGKMPPPLLRLVPAPGRCLLPSCDWCPLREDAFSPPAT